MPNIQVEKTVGRGSRSRFEDVRCSQGKKHTLPRQKPPLPTPKTPITIMSKVRDKAAQIIDLTEECPICLETMEDGACYLSCTHNFCFPCLLKHLSTSKRNCPCCRRPILESTTEIEMGAAPIKVLNCFDLSNCNLKK